MQIFIKANQNHEERTYIDIKIPYSYDFFFICLHFIIFNRY